MSLVNCEPHCLHQVAPPTTVDNSVYFSQFHQHQRYPFFQEAGPKYCEIVTTSPLRLDIQIGYASTVVTPKYELVSLYIWLQNLFAYPCPPSL